jgi:hypothetical protein
MTSMANTVDITSEEREEIRLRFFREHRSQTGFSSVAVRRDRESGDWFLDVAATGALDVEPTYMGLEVRVKQTAGAVNAVGPIDQVV